MQFTITEELPFAAWYIVEEFDPFNGRFEPMLVDATAVTGAQLITVVQVQETMLIPAEAATSLSVMRSPVQFPVMYSAERLVLDPATGLPIRLADGSYWQLLEPGIALRTVPQFPVMLSDAEAATDVAALVAPHIIREPLYTNATAVTSARLVWVQFFPVLNSDAQATTEATLRQVPQFPAMVQDAQPTTTATLRQVHQFPVMYSAERLVLNPATGQPLRLANGSVWPVLESGITLRQVHRFGTLYSDAEAVTSATVIEGTP